MVIPLVIGVLVLTGLVVDGGRLFTASRHANNIAAGASRAGAQAIDEDSVRAGRAILDPEVARINARRYLLANGFDGDVTVTETTVTVEVATTVHPIMLTMVGLGDRTVAGHATARIQQGI